MSNRSKMNRALRKKMIRRVKRELPAQFVPITAVREEINLSAEWQDWYDEIAAHVAALHDQKAIGSPEFIYQLRMAAIHPALVNKKYLPDPEKRYPPLAESPKIKLLLKMIREKTSKGEKVVVFSMSRTVIDTLGELLQAGAADSGCVLLKPDDDSAQISAKEELFRSDPNKKIFLTTYDKGAESLNLEAANHVIKIDVPWDPETNVQAENRVHRVTQKKDVQVHTLIARGTIDEDLERIVKEKMVKFSEIVDARLLIDVLGANFVRDIIKRSKAGSSSREAFYLDYRAMRTNYARGEIQGGNQLRQRVVASYHLGPLDSGETQGYIEHRLRTVGWQGTPSFDGEAFAALHRFTGGIPRRINTFCDRLLLFGFLEEKSYFGEAEINEVISDLKSEVAHQDFQGPTGVSGMASGDELQGEDHRLALRVEQMERSVNRILPIVRKILFTVSERQGQPDSPDSSANASGS